MVHEWQTCKEWKAQRTMELFLCTNVIKSSKNIQNKNFKMYMPTKNTFSILKNIQNIQQDLLSEKEG